MLETFTLVLILWIGTPQQTEEIIVEGVSLVTCFQRAVMEAGHPRYKTVPVASQCRPDKGKSA